MKKFVFAFILLILFSSSAFAKTVPGDVLVIFKNPSENKVGAASLASDGEHSAYAASVASAMDARVAITYDTLSENSNEIFALVHSDTKTEQELLQELLARPDVKGASLNHINHLASKTPSDTLYNLQWGMKAIKADEVWDKTTGSSSIYVAVIDSGIDATHEDLAGNIATEYCRGYDANGNVINDYSDIASMGHGSHVSGIIGAIADNDTGVAGVNWKTKIIMFKLHYTEEEGFSDASIILALQDIFSLVRQGVNIASVNISLGGWEDNAPDKISNSSNPLWSALRAVSDAGVVICVAAGNEGQAVGVPTPIDDPYTSVDELRKYSKGDYVYPGSFLNIPNMIVVAAASQDVNGKIIRSGEEDGESDSNYSSKYVHIAAPGSHVVSTVPMDYEYESDTESVGVTGYASWAGTSMATPHVAGAVALLKAAYPKATGAQIRRAIFKGADGNYCKNDSDYVSYEDPKAHTKDNTSKYGFLNVRAAYDALPGIMEAQANATTKPTAYNVTTEFVSATSKVLTLNVGENDYGESAQVGDKFYVWLTKQLAAAADDDYYVTVVKTAGQLDIDVNNLYEEDGETKASIEAGTYKVSYKSEDGTISGGYDTPVELEATTSSTSGNISSSGSGCNAGVLASCLLALPWLVLYSRQKQVKNGGTKN